MNAATLTAILLRLGHPHAGPADHVRARHLAAAILLRADAHQIDPVLVAALIARESTFRPNAVSAVGKDLGLMQVRRGGAVTPKHAELTDAALMQVPINLAIGIAYMASVRKLCGAAAGPIEWLSVYKGFRRCKPSAYSRAIVRAAARASEVEPR